ncbi:MAG TPA: SdrD B-like domain-containing protein [Anaerolineales bacterium]|nr:SdrD B-like domain-containing protein [Anaerolineales bacterium]
MYRKFILCFLILLIAACSNNSSQPQPIETNTPLKNITATATATQSPPANTATPQPLPSPVTLGPDEFPEAYNPLSGQRVADPALLNIPALLISISHFPPAARPQAGMSFSPFVYEYMITEGATRHLAVFYGEGPAPEVPLHGDCAIRQEPLARTNNILGNRVWYDQNQNGVQDPGENGIGGICVNLLDANGKSLQQTTTDSNGYYGFDVQAGKYTIEVEKPSWLEFAPKNVGDEGTDSDVDQATGRIDMVNVSSSSTFFWDAGLVPSLNMTPTPDASVKLPTAQIGPVRSGRLLYRHIQNFYQDSCLIYAGADPVVRAQIPGCAIVPHTDTGGGAMLAMERFKKIQEEVSEKQPRYNYASNLYSDKVPTGGKAAKELSEFWARLNQSKWVYDAASEAWWRYVDESNPEKVGVLHADTDRLTGRQLKFENLILLFAEHTVVTPTIVDINMAVGQKGKAFLFRDGQVYDIRWSTVAGEYEQTTGLRRPIRFLNLDGTPAALKPGHTWVIIFDLQSSLNESAPGSWLARFIAPAGSKQE